MKVFVYGTLKSGYNNNRILTDGKATLVEENRIIDGYKLYDFGFPVARVSEGDRIKGEVWELREGDENTLRRLDALEGHPNQYIRTEVGDVSLYVGPDDRFGFERRVEEPKDDNGVYFWDREWRRT